MQCDECMIDMRVKEVKDNIYLFECTKCGKNITKTMQELEADYKKLNKVNRETE